MSRYHSLQLTLLSCGRVYIYTQVVSPCRSFIHGQGPKEPIILRQFFKAIVRWELEAEAHVLSDVNMYIKTVRVRCSEANRQQYEHQ